MGTSCPPQRSDRVFRIQTYNLPNNLSYQSRKKISLMFKLHGLIKLIEEIRYLPTVWFPICYLSCSPASGPSPKTVCLKRQRMSTSTWGIPFTKPSDVPHWTEEGGGRRQGSRKWIHFQSTDCGLTTKFFSQPNFERIGKANLGNFLSGGQESGGQELTEGLFNLTSYLIFKNESIILIKLCLVILRILNNFK